MSIKGHIMHIYDDPRGLIRSFIGNRNGISRQYTEAVARLATGRERLPGAQSVPAQGFSLPCANYWITTKICRPYIIYIFLFINNTAPKILKKNCRPVRYSTGCTRLSAFCIIALRNYTKGAVSSSGILDSNMIIYKNKNLSFILSSSRQAIAYWKPR